MKTLNTVLFLSLAAIGIYGCSDNKVAEIEATAKSSKMDINDIRTLQAQQSQAINEIRNELRTLTGRVEELQHTSTGKTQELEQTLSALRSRVPPPAGVPEELLDADDQKIASIPGPAAEQYKKALTLIRSGAFDAARAEFESFSEANPGTAFTDNALFWLGISRSQLGQYDGAVVAFSEVFQKYPAEDMVAPALYYLADAFVKMGSKQDAILTLQKLVDEKKGSPYAARGREKLQELQGGRRRK